MNWCKHYSSCLQLVHWWRVFLCLMQNIKKLLKIAYSRSNVSMMVHRVSNTLMLDEFDIHRYLLRQQDDDWKWLRKFFYETVLRNMKQRNRVRAAALSRFLCCVRSFNVSSVCVLMVNCIFHAVCEHVWCDCTGEMHNTEDKESWECTKQTHVLQVSLLQVIFVVSCVCSVVWNCLQFREAVFRNLKVCEFVDNIYN